MGYEYNPAVDEVNFIGNWVALLETANQPMVNFGTSSDRIFTPEGNQNYFVTLAKTIPNTRLAPYVGLSYSEFKKGWLVPAGLNWAFDPAWSFLSMYDGVNAHLLLTYKAENWNLTGMYLKGQRWGISYGIGF